MPPKPTFKCQPCSGPPSKASVEDDDNMSLSTLCSAYAAAKTKGTAGKLTAAGGESVSRSSAGPRPVFEAGSRGEPRRRFETEVPVSDAVVGDQGDWRRDPAPIRLVRRGKLIEPGEVIDCQSLEIREEYPLAPIAKANRHRYNWVARTENGRFTRDPEKMVPFIRCDGAIGKWTCDVCGKVCEAQLFMFRAYLRRDFLAAEIRQRMLDPFVAYISSTCGKGLLGHMTSVSKFKEEVFSLTSVAMPMDQVRGQLEEALRRGNKEDRQCLLDELERLAGVGHSAGGSRTLEMEAVEKLFPGQPPLHRMEEDAFRAVARSLAPRVGARLLAAGVVLQAERDRVDLSRWTYLSAVKASLEAGGALPQVSCWSLEEVCTALDLLSRAINSCNDGGDRRRRGAASAAEPVLRLQLACSWEGSSLRTFGPESAPATVRLGYLQGRSVLHAVVDPHVSKEVAASVHQKLEDAEARWPVLMASDMDSAGQKSAATLGLQKGSSNRHVGRAESLGFGWHAADWAHRMKSMLGAEFDFTRKPLRLVTGCSGAEAPHFALKELVSDAGYEHLWSAEINENPRRFELKNCKMHHCFEDICYIMQGGGRCAKHGGNCGVPAGDVDIFVGGFPCTPYSFCNPKRYKRNCFKEPAAVPFFEMRKFIVARRPRLVILENVRGLLAPNPETDSTPMHFILRGRNPDTKADCYPGTEPGDDWGLEYIKGYSLSWDILYSYDWGLPQARPRVYIVMVREDAGGETAVKRIFDIIKAGRGRMPRGSFNDFLFPDSDPRIQHAMRWWQAHDKRDKRGKRAPCSKYAEALFRTKCQELGIPNSARPYSGKMPQSWFPHGTEKQVRSLDIVYCTGERDGLDFNFLLTDLSQQVSRKAWRDDGHIPTLTTGSLLYSFKRQRLFAGDENMWLQGFPVDEINLDAHSESERVFLAGNAMSVPVIGAVIFGGLVACNWGEGRTNRVGVEVLPEAVSERPDATKLVDDDGPVIMSCQAGQGLFDDDDDGAVTKAIEAASQERKPQPSNEELVNDDGAPVALGNANFAQYPGGDGTGRYYCGRHLGSEAIPGSDGQCGPEGGPQCPSCARFQAKAQNQSQKARGKAGASTAGHQAAGAGGAAVAAESQDQSHVRRAAILLALARDIESQAKTKEKKDKDKPKEKKEKVGGLAASMLGAAAATAEKGKEADGGESSGSDEDAARQGRAQQEESDDDGMGDGTSWQERTTMVEAGNASLPELTRWLAESGSLLARMGRDEREASAHGLRQFSGKALQQLQKLAPLPESEAGSGASAPETEVGLWGPKLRSTVELLWQDVKLPEAKPLFGRLLATSLLSEVPQNEKQEDSWIARAATLKDSDASQYRIKLLSALQQPGRKKLLVRLLAKLLQAWRRDWAVKDEELKKTQQALSVALDIWKRDQGPMTPAGEESVWCGLSVVVNTGLTVKDLSRRCEELKKPASAQELKQLARGFFEEVAPVRAVVLMRDGNAIAVRAFAKEILKAENQLKPAANKEPATPASVEAATLNPAGQLIERFCKISAELPQVREEAMKWAQARTRKSALVLAGELLKIRQGTMRQEDVDLANALDTWLQNQLPELYSLVCQAMQLLESMPLPTTTGEETELWRQSVAAKIWVTEAKVRDILADKSNNLAEWSLNLSTHLKEIRKMHQSMGGQKEGYEAFFDYAAQEIVKRQDDEARGRVAEAALRQMGFEKFVEKNPQSGHVLFQAYKEKNLEVQLTKFKCASKDQQRIIEAIRHAATAEPQLPDEWEHMPSSMGLRFFSLRQPPGVKKGPNKTQWTWPDVALPKPVCPPLEKDEKAVDAAEAQAGTEGARLLSTPPEDPSTTKKRKRKSGSTTPPPQPLVREDKAVRPADEDVELDKLEDQVLGKLPLMHKALLRRQVDPGSQADEPSVEPVTGRKVIEPASQEAAPRKPVPPKGPPPASLLAAAVQPRGPPPAHLLQKKLKAATEMAEANDVPRAVESVASAVSSVGQGLKGQPDQPAVTDDQRYGGLDAPVSMHKTDVPMAQPSQQTHVSLREEHERRMAARKILPSAQSAFIPKKPSPTPIPKDKATPTPETSHPRAGKAKQAWELSTAAAEVEAIEQELEAGNGAPGGGFTLRPANTLAEYTKRTQQAMAEQKKQKAVEDAKAKAQEMKRQAPMSPKQAAEEAKAKAKEMKRQAPMSPKQEPAGKQSPGSPSSSSPAHHSGQDAWTSQADGWTQQPGAWTLQTDAWGQQSAWDAPKTQSRAAYIPGATRLANTPGATQVGNPKRQPPPPPPPPRASAATSGTARYQQMPKSPPAEKLPARGAQTGWRDNGHHWSPRSPASPRSPDSPTKRMRTHGAG